MSMYQSSPALQSPVQQKQIPPSPLSTSSVKPSETSSSDSISMQDLKPRLQAKVEIPSALVPLAKSTRLSFTKALAADQEAVLRPDYRTSFRNVNDVVKRLLPYHVWNINEDDLRWAMQDEADESSSSASRIGKRKRRIKQGENVDHPFPSSDEASRLFARQSTLNSCARKLRYKMTGGTSGLEGSLFHNESLYNIEKLAVEQERDLLAIEYEKLRQAKEMAISTGVAWEELAQINSAFPLAVPMQAMPPSTVGILASGQVVNGYPLIAFQKSVGSLQGTSAATPGRVGQTKTSTGTTTPKGNVDSLPTTPQDSLSKGSKRRGRPRKTRDQNGRIVATPPLVRPSETPQRHNTDVTSSTASSSSVKKPVTPISAAPIPAPVPTKTQPQPIRPPLQRPPPPSSSLSSPLPLPATSPAPAIPSHPIPLVLPLSTLSRLSSLGIAPVPAPHLLPVISAQQAQRQNESRNGSSTPSLPISTTIHSTAPRPAPANQQEPALLMGITEAPCSYKADGEQGKTMNSTQQMLHVSVVLSKLSPSQLSGLANLMQSLQNPPATTTTTSTTAAPSVDGKHSSGASR